MKTAVFDIETDGLLDQVTKVHSLCVSSSWAGSVSCSDQPGYVPIADGLKLLEEADVLVGHNIMGFDLLALKKVYPTLELKGLVRDTLVISRLIWSDIQDRDSRLFKKGVLPGYLVGLHKLKAWGFRLHVHKGDFHENADWSQWTKEMQDYCMRDVVVTEALWNLIDRQNYSEQSIQLEHDFQAIIHTQEATGWRFDEAAAHGLHGRLVGELETIKHELQQVFPPRIETMKSVEYYSVSVEKSLPPLGGPSFSASTKSECQNFIRKNKAIGPWFIHPGPLRTKSHPFNPGSRDEIAHRLKAKGWVPTKFTDSGKPQVDETVLEGIDIPEAKLVNRYLLLTKRIGQLATGDKAWLKLAKNGRIHGRVITNGAVTGRVTHMNPNLSQVPANDAPFGHECRSLFTTDPGYSMVGCDAAGMQLRDLAHYMAKYDGGAYGREIIEGDIHTANQIAAGIDTRAKAKTFIYAYLFGAGDLKIGRTVGLGEGEVDRLKKEEKARWKKGRAGLERTIERFKREHPGKLCPFIVDDQTIAYTVKGSILKSSFEEKTPALAELKADIAGKVEAKGYLVGLDGRRLHIRSPHAALNTLLQDAEAVLMKQANVFAHRNLASAGFVRGKDFMQLGFNHDEIQTQALTPIATQVGEIVAASITQAGEYYNFRVPLKGEFKVGRNWAETH